VVRTSLLMLAVGLGACSLPQPAWIYDQQVDFTALQRYDWVPAPQLDAAGARGPAQLRLRVQELVDERLQEKGFRRVARNPDALLGFYLSVERHPSITRLDPLYGYGAGWSYPRYTREYDYPGRDAVLSEERGATLILDLRRADDRRLIWRGWTSDKSCADPEQLAGEHCLARAIQRILARFPPSR
jgi:hypothetical protein